MFRHHNQSRVKTVGKNSLYDMKNKDRVCLFTLGDILKG